MAENTRLNQLIISCLRREPWPKTATHSEEKSSLGRWGWMWGLATVVATILWPLQGCWPRWPGPRKQTNRELGWEVPTQELFPTTGLLIRWSNKLSSEVKFVWCGFLAHAAKYILPNMWRFKDRRILKRSQWLRQQDHRNSWLENPVLQAKSAASCPLSKCSLRSALYLAPRSVRRQGERWTRSSFVSAGPELPAHSGNWLVFVPPLGILFKMPPFNNYSQLSHNTIVTSLKTDLLGRLYGRTFGIILYNFYCAICIWLYLYVICIILCIIMYNLLYITRNTYMALSKFPSSTLHTLKILVRWG